MRPLHSTWRALGAAALVPCVTAAAEPGWLSPAALAAAPDGRTLYVACETGRRVLALDLETRKVIRETEVALPPTGIALSGDGKTLAVTCAGTQSMVCLIDTGKGSIRATLKAGHTATAPTFSPDGARLYVCNRYDNEVAVLDTATGKLLARIPVRREPTAADITPDGRFLLVANLLPAGRADADHVAASVSVIDTGTARVVDDLWLPNGSTGLHAVEVSPDGKHAVVTHILARHQMPTTQLDRGWMNTNAKTIIGLDPPAVINTVLLDSVDRGAANPWGAAWTADSRRVVVAHAGTHEVSVVDFPGVLEKIRKTSAPAATPSPGAYPQWGASSGSQVPNDLAFLVGLRKRHRLPETDLGPRAIAVAGRRVVTANYFSDTLTFLDLDATHPVPETVALGPVPQPTPERRGEMHFHDARICFQGWQSCATCHPGQGRVDGLNWDLLNDGIGNPKNNKSLLLSYRTPPAMSTGARDSAEVAVRSGIHHILFTVQPAEVAESMDAWLKSLEPVPSPHRVDGALSAAARRGEQLFNSPKTRCAECHPGPLFTDLKAYDVGTRSVLDKAGTEFDTPTLIESWRTAPYLHNGSAATIREVFTTANPGDQHGVTSHLSADEILDLCAYVLSL